MKSCNIGALIGIAFWGILCYNYNISNPQNPILIIKALTFRWRHYSGLKFRYVGIALWLLGLGRGATRGGKFSSLYGENPGSTWRSDLPRILCEPSG